MPYDSRGRSILPVGRTVQRLFHLSASNQKGCRLPLLPLAVLFKILALTCFLSRMLFVVNPLAHRVLCFFLSPFISIFIGNPVLPFTFTDILLVSLILVPILFLLSSCLKFGILRLVRKELHMKEILAKNTSLYLVTSFVMFSAVLFSFLPFAGGYLLVLFFLAGFFFALGMNLELFNAILPARKICSFLLFTAFYSLSALFILITGDVILHILFHA